MSELKKVFLDLGYNKVETVLATGNVILEAEEVSPLKLKIDIEAHLAKVFHYEAHVIVKNAMELEQMLKIPYVKDDHMQHYIILTEQKDIYEAIYQGYEALKDERHERLYTLEDALHWEVEKGYTLKTDFGKKLLGSKVFQSKLTTRSIGTIEKIVEKLV